MDGLQRCIEVGLGGQVCIFSLFEFQSRDNLLFEEFLLAVILPFSLVHACFESFLRGRGISHLSLLLVHDRRRLVALRSEDIGIDPGKQLSFLHTITFHHRQFDNLSRYVRADLHLHLRIYFSTGSNDFGDISPGNRLHGNLSPLFLTNDAGFLESEEGGDHCDHANQ